MSHNNFFKGKKVTQIGLGLLGRGVGDAEFLAESGAELVVTDLKTEAELAPSVERLKKYSAQGGSASGGKNITFVFGRHRLADFRNRDFILKGPGIPLDSPYIAEARKNHIPIEMDASLFAKLVPKGVILVGVTGTRGKTTTTMLIYKILQAAGKRVRLGGNIKDVATLPLLKEVREGDIVVLELDSWQLQGFGESKISPHIAVFTTFLPDHLNYYTTMERYFADKANIFKFQKQGDVFVIGEQVLSVRFDLGREKGRTLVAKSADVPSDWHIQLLGEHNRLNIACAISACRALGVTEGVIKTAVEAFRGVPGRLQFVKEVHGVKIYNDNNATTPDATIAALKALFGNRVFGNSVSKNPDKQGPTLIRKEVGPLKRKIILIMGGKDKVPDYHGLADEIPKWCKALVLLKETGTEKFKPLIQGGKFKDVVVSERDGLPECFREAVRLAQRGDIILFSPAFASFGKWFKNEYDRGEQFEKIVSSLE